MSERDWSRLTRPHYPMPEDLAAALKAHKLLDKYHQRPPYQQNDYIGWLDRAKRPETRQKRLLQIIDELKRGGVYMNMSWKPKRKGT